VTSNCTQMACSTDCKGSSRIPHSSWTVDKLKEFLKEKGLSTTGKKSELVRRVSDFIETEELESELGGRSEVNPAPSCYAEIYVRI